MDTAHKTTRIRRITLCLLALCMIGVSLEGASRYLHQQTLAENRLTGMVSSAYEGAFQCILPWHVGRQLKGYGIEGHPDYACQWRRFWVEWRELTRPDPTHVPVTNN